MFVTLGRAPNSRLRKGFELKYEHWLEDKKFTSVGKLWQFRQTPCADLDAYAALREHQLAIGEECIIQGVPAQDTAQLVARSGGEVLRRGDTLLDAPRSFLTIDIDAFPTERIRSNWRVGKGLRADIEVMLTELFDGVANELLDAGCVATISSKTGLVDGKLSVHATWLLAEPTLLTVQRAYVKGLTEKIKGLDLSIYKPSSIIYTARPQLYKETLGGGRELVEHPYQGPRVFQYPGPALKLPLVVVPQEAVAEDWTDRRFGTLPPADLSDITAESTHTPLLRLAWRAARQLPRGQFEEWAEETSAAAWARIQEVQPTPEAARVKWEADARPEELLRLMRSAVLKTNRSLEQKAVTAQPLAAVKQEAVLTDRERLAKDMHETMEAARLGAVQHTLFTTQPGAGKTHAVHSYFDLARLLHGWVVMLSPTVQLSAESSARMRKQLHAYLVGRGRTDAAAEAELSEALRVQRSFADTCQDDVRKSVGAALTPHIRPHTSLCPTCPLKDSCPYPKLREQFGKPGIDFVQHAHATTLLQRPVSEKSPWLTIVDEQILNTLLSGDGQQLSIDSLKSNDCLDILCLETPEGNFATISQHRKSEYANADRRVARVALWNALAKIDGNVHLTHVNALLPDIETFLESEYDLQKNLQRLLDGLVRAAVRDNAAGLLAQPSGLVSRLSMALSLSQYVAKVFRTIRDSNNVPARTEVFGLKTLERDGIRLMDCFVRDRLPEYLRERSVIYLDGSAQRGVYETFSRSLGRDLKVFDHSPKTGAYRLTQYLHKFGKTGLLTEDEALQIGRLHRFILTRAAAIRRKRGNITSMVNGHIVDVLVVAQQDVEAALRKAGVPDNVYLAHFNALRGLDTFRHVGAVFTIGRPMPTIETLERITRAIHFDNKRVPFLQQHAGLLNGMELLKFADGTTERIEGERHTDVHVQEVIETLVNAEVRQALNRARLYDRTAENACEIHVFGTVPTGLLVHEVGDLTTLDPGVLDILQAAGTAPMLAGDFRRTFGLEVDQSALSAALSVTQWSRADNFLTADPLSPAMFGLVPNGALVMPL